MGNLIQAAQSLDISKGVSVYTVTHFNIDGLDLRSSNLSNNFSSGIVPRVDKNEIKSTNAYVYDENGKLEKPIVYSDFIGRLYYQNDDIENSSFKFITENGFTKFENSIREENLRNKIDDTYANASVEDYEGNIFGDYSTEKAPMVSKIGDEYSVKKHVLHIDHENLKDSGSKYASKLMFYTRNVSTLIGNYGLSSENRYEYMGLFPSNLMDIKDDYDAVTNHRDRNYTFGQLQTKDIVKIGEYEREKYILRNYRYDFDYFLENIGPDQELGEGIGNNRYGDIERLPEVPYLMTTLGKFGLYSYYDDQRFSSMNNEYNLYTNNKQYALGPETEEDNPFDNFSINKKESDFVSIITKGNKGSVNDGYYREHDEGGLPNLLSGSDKTVKNLFMPYSGNAVSGYSKLLQRTNSMFYNRRIGSLINRFHTSIIYGYNGEEYNVASDDNELITAKSKYGLSRGRNLLANGVDDTTGYENPYCRVWTAHHQYGKIKTLIRPFKGGYNSVGKVQEMYNGTELRTESGETAFNNHTVLMDNGFVRISPSHDETFYDDKKNANIKSYMFSIENLAWRDIHIEKALSKEQRGPNGGRIMWFPPYNLKFTENVNVDWNANKFIGRGEQIYTYTNTDRKGTLDFTLLIDHPSIINKWRGTAGSVDDEEERENEILRFFAGCDGLEGSCGNGVENKPEKKEPEGLNINPTYEGKDRKIALVLFFPNNFSAYDYKNNIEYAVDTLRVYEDSTNPEDTFTFEDQDIENKQYENINKNGYNMNYVPTDDAKKKIKELLFNNDENIEFYSFFDPDYGYDNLNTIIGDVNSENGSVFNINEKNIRIELIDAEGHASSHGLEKNNKGLVEHRRDFIAKAVANKCNKINIKDIVKEPFNGSSIIKMNDVGEGANRDINKLDAKIARCAILVFRIKYDENTKTVSLPLEDGSHVINGQNYDSATEKSENSSQTKSTSVSISQSEYSYDNEYLYFVNLRNDELTYQKVVERIRYFNPAYHSITPEGFNSRLTFLHQCTRQGPTLDLSSGHHNEDSTNYVKYAGNLSFGRAPYCILRIGDFFNTKICIDSISINYDNSGGVQWDLNPEGVGVQPMFANISISFTFVGGQDITGPIERLQNAVTSNYYANASVYDKKADKKGEYAGEGKWIGGKRWDYELKK